MRSTVPDSWYCNDREKESRDSVEGQNRTQALGAGVRAGLAPNSEVATK
jgi:hypothetical protein